MTEVVMVVGWGVAWDVGVSINPPPGTEVVGTEGGVVGTAVEVGAGEEAVSAGACDSVSFTMLQ